MSLEDKKDEGKVKLLKESGYSEKAMEYFLNETNVGKLKDANAFTTYTGSCGDTMSFYLKIESNIIIDARFQAIGCAGSYVSGSALIELVRNQTLEFARKITEEEIIGHLGGLPQPKVHCACLAVRTLKRAIDCYNPQ